MNLLRTKKRKLDISCIQLDSSHTRCRQKGASAGYQARKKVVTTNSIFLCDNKGQMIAMGSPKAGIEHKGLFLNADAGFYSKSVREFLESKEIIANIKKNIFFIIVVFI